MPSPSSGRRPGVSTLAVHGVSHPTGEGTPVVPPIVQSATFLGGRAGEPELRYTRHGNNPTQLYVQQKLAALEGTEAALVLASGMAATAMTLLALTRVGDHIVASSHLYGTTRKLLAEELTRRGVHTTFVDPNERRAWGDAIRDTTRLLFLELPTNPTLRVFDPRPLARLAHDRGMALVVDATFASPVNLRPTALGVDVVIHSASKYLGGHSDLIAGVVAGSEAVVGEVAAMMRLYGPALDPHAAWLLDRGLRTLDVRVQRENDNALRLARWLEAQPQVARVLYPALETHPDHALASELMQGHGAVVSFVLAGGGSAADAFVDALRIALVAPSLGGVETLVSQPRYTSHAGTLPEERAAAGIPDGFVRVSVGVEAIEDLIDDFRQALECVEAGLER